MNFKKATIIAALVLSSNAMAADAPGVIHTDPSASVVWSGLVPGSVEGSAIKITGLGGGAFRNGTLSVAPDGTFTSSEINLESRLVENGDLKEATWTLTNSVVKYGSSDATAAKLTVKNNGAQWTEGLAIGKTSRINLSVAQDAAIDTAVGDAVQVQVTVVASADI